MEIDWSDVRVPLTPGVQEEILRVTGIPGLARWRDLGGSWSTNIAASRAGTSDWIVLRIHQRFVDRDRLLAEQETRRALAALGCPTIPALPIFQGSTVGRLSSGNLVEAEPLVVSDATMDIPDRLIDGFAVLGAVHDGLRTATLPLAARTVTYANHLDVQLVAERTSAGIARIKSWRRPELTTFADQLAVHLANVANHETPYLSDQHSQIVHGDFWDNNVLFANGKVAAVLDFGFMAERDRIDDLALPIWYYLLEQTEPTGATIATVASIVGAYDEASSHPLTSAERLRLPLVIARQPAWLVGRWVPFETDEAQAEVHVRRAAAEFHVASEVLNSLQRWQQALTG